MDAALLAAGVQGPGIVQTHEAREAHSSLGHVPFNAGPVNAGAGPPSNQLVGPKAHEADRVPSPSGTPRTPRTPDCFDHPMLDLPGHSELEVKALSKQCRGVTPAAALDPAYFASLWRKVRVRSFSLQ